MRTGRLKLEDRKFVNANVALAQNGDREVLGEIFQILYPHVKAYIASIVRDEHAAEDITHDVFVKFMVKPDSYEEDPDVPFSGWLLRVSRNAALDYLTYKSYRQPSEAVTNDYVKPTYPEDPSIIYEQRELFTEIFVSLPEDQRQILFDRFVAGYKATEIEGIMGKTESSVAGLLHRARRGAMGIIDKRDDAPKTSSAIDIKVRKVGKAAIVDPPSELAA